MKNKMKCRRRFFLTSLVVIFLSLCISAQAQQKFKPDSPAPDIHIQKFLNYDPPGEDLFKGKTLILEFWATWCKPCINSIPHINNLVDKFGSDSVLFISISKESPAKVEYLLKKKTLKSYVAIDLNGKTNKNYKIRHIPQAYIIDSYGRIAWEGHPLNLDDKTLEKIINKKHIKFDNKE
ncbi:TlpA family protein disulfide reductase [Bacteroidota bacterium]